jgi:hypothetical protein
MRLVGFLQGTARVAYDWHFGDSLLTLELERPRDMR